jgi:hypothetical protein
MNGNSQISRGVTRNYLDEIDKALFAAATRVISDGSTMQVRVGHKRENFNTSCYSATTMLNELFSKISGWTVSSSSGHLPCFVQTCQKEKSISGGCLGT